MRDSLYIWHEPDKKLVHTSGIEFRDLVPTLEATTAGLLLLSHELSDVVLGPRGLDFVWAFDLREQQDLPEEFGDFVWADIPIQHEPEFLPEPSPADLAALLYFGHCLEPLDAICLPSLGNRFLASGHDGGFLLDLFYATESDVRHLLKPVFETALPDAGGAVFERGLATERAILVHKGEVREVDRAQTIDGFFQDGGFTWKMKPSFAVSPSSNRE